ncbi:unnamed protein product [Acanthocheilonema viteae]|uniref:SRR1-like domain-containing protein n=1 Tax=Acanthocheilonema viteae TaxID=6277 RepID=A0A498S8Z9_ACAVI|nr:unnamed protein product [Acanthocheilonema viteae]
MTSQIGKETTFASDDNEQFIVVKRNGRKSWRRSRGRGEKVVATAICSPEDQVSVERIDAIIKNACNNTELIKYSQQIIALLLKSLSGRQLSSIWALGLGSFSRSYYPGCDQLAMLLELKYHFGCEVHFQEPCLTKMEKRWLCDHAICLSETNDLLECRVSDDDVNKKKIVLFYAPHCGHAVYNSNNFYSMDLTARHLEKYAGSVLSQEDVARKCRVTDLKMSDCCELQALSLYSKVCTLLEFPTFKSNFAVFNDTALHFLPQNALLPEISEIRPNYRLFRHEIVI